MMVNKTINFTDNEIDEIISNYNKGYNCHKIGIKFNVSKTTINKILKEKGILRKGTSNGTKISLSEIQKVLIKNLYIECKKTPKEISTIIGLNKHFLDKHIKNEGYLRTKSESISLRQIGKKRSDKTCNILKEVQKKISESGNRIQSGGVCKKYIINGIECHGTYEKFYIEKLLNENELLPKNSSSIITPYGVYYPDFSKETSYIEIKSEYTYDVLIGKKINRWTKKIDTNQLEKIKWVNKNVLPVEIYVVDKRNNKLIKKEIE